MRVVQLAMQGLSHCRQDIPCQDRTAALTADGVICIALADGAGSASHSHVGAQVAVDTTVQLLCREFEKFYEDEDSSSTRTTLIGELMEALSCAAEDQGCPIKELASTLLFAAQKDDRYIVGQLGDGGIAFLRDGRCRLVARPERGEFINDTWFVTSPRAVEHLRLYKGRLGSIMGFFLMSDGAAESLYQRREDEVAPFVSRLIHDVFCKSPTWIMDSIVPFFQSTILRRTTDDCSIAVMSTCRNYRAFFENMDRSSTFRLFYKAKYIKKEYTDDYIAILMAAAQTDDMVILSKLVGIKLPVLRRRISRLRKLGFRDILKYTSMS